MAQTKLSANVTRHIYSAYSAAKSALCKSIAYQLAWLTLSALSRAHECPKIDATNPRLTLHFCSLPFETLIRIFPLILYLIQN